MKLLDFPTPKPLCSCGRRRTCMDQCALCWREQWARQRARGVTPTMVRERRRRRRKVSA